MRFRQKAGVLMVEMALAMIVASMITGVIFSLTNLYGFTDRIDHTRERMNYIDQAMRAYFKKNGMLPVPSLLDIGYDDDRYGEAAGSYADGVIPNGLMHSGSDSDMVFVGAVPFKDLAIPEDYAYDTWDNKIVYVVVADLTRSKTNFAQYQTKLTNGVIEITDQHNNVLGNSGNKVNAYLLLSYGKNRSGAYNSGGVKVPCLDGKAESVNCNNLANAGPFITSTLNYLDGPDYYDDILLWTELSALRAEYHLTENIDEIVDKTNYKDLVGRYLAVNDIMTINVKSMSDGTYLVHNTKDNPILSDINGLSNYSSAFVIVLVQGHNATAIDELRNGDVVYVDGLGPLNFDGNNLEYSGHSSGVFVVEEPLEPNQLPRNDGYYVINKSPYDSRVVFKKGEFLIELAKAYDGVPDGCDIWYTVIYNNKAYSYSTASSYSTGRSAWLAR